MSDETTETLAEQVEKRALNRIPGSDLEESAWESLPADSESEVDYPKATVEVGGVTYLGQKGQIQTPGVIDQFELPAGVPVGDFVPDLVVTMSVMFPDGSMWEHVERVPFPEDSDLDMARQADAMVDEVTESMRARVKRTVL